MFSCFNPAKMDRPDFGQVAAGGDSANDLGLPMHSEQGEHISEKIAAVPNLTISGNFKAKNLDTKSNTTAFDFDPSRRFVRELTRRSDYRSCPSLLLCALCWPQTSGHTQPVCPAGAALPSLSRTTASAARAAPPTSWPTSTMSSTPSPASLHCVRSASTPLSNTALPCPSQM